MDFENVIKASNGLIFSYWTVSIFWVSLIYVKALTEATGPPSRWELYLPLLFDERDEVEEVHLEETAGSSKI